MLSSDVVVVGTGPAGLAAACACHKSGLNVLLIERGKIASARQRDSRRDIPAGIGGAGLYSDGKFSFYPSATELWQLRPEAVLREAYEWYGRQLREFGFESPPFPNNPREAPLDQEALSRFYSKDYLSKYLTFDERLRLISTLTVPFEKEIQTGLEVLNITPKDHGVELVARDSNASTHVFSARKGAVIAPGRFGPLALRNIFSPDAFYFKRLEVGVRLEQPASRFFLRDTSTVDAKRIWHDDKQLAEWRTFCCCREGEVVCTLSDNILSVSGRSDGPPTSRSNVGIHVRILDERTAERAWTYLRSELEELQNPITEPLSIFLEDAESRIAMMLGPDIAELLRRGLRELLDRFPAASVDAQLACTRFG